MLGHLTADWLGCYGNPTCFTASLSCFPVSCIIPPNDPGFFFIDPGVLHAEATGETCEQSNSA